MTNRIANWSNSALARPGRSAVGLHWSIARNFVGSNVGRIREMMTNLLIPGPVELLRKHHPTLVFPD